MATYNGAQYIEEQLESIRIQTMPVDEVRICDDGSSDDTVEVICHYIREHGFFGSRFDKLRLSSDSGSCSEGRESSSGADQTEELSAIQGHEKSPMMLLIVTDNYCQLIGSTGKIY